MIDSGHPVDLGLAILAGDGLLTEAFHLSTRPDLMKKVSPSRRIRALWHLARAAGSWGMVGGQTIPMSGASPKTVILITFVPRPKGRAANVTPSM